MSKDAPKKDVSPSASQLWRDRLQKTQSAQQQNKSGGKQKSKTSVDIPNRFVKTASGDTAQKTRKGMRPQ